ncbi:MAG: hypothetical protein HRU12_07390 [Phaeodactylibacter sp.]|nr:hypothetical protein [Phaeodactylibacter sp.]
MKNMLYVVFALILTSCAKESEETERKYLTIEATTKTESQFDLTVVEYSKADSLPISLDEFQYNSTAVKYQHEVLDGVIVGLILSSSDTIISFDYNCNCPVNVGTDSDKLKMLSTE